MTKMVQRRLSYRIPAGIALGGVIITSACLSWCQQPVSALRVMALQAHAEAASVPAENDKRTAKQKLLDDEMQRLVTMASELKTEVDKTNKNVLSLHVVRKAEEIEALAHKMKDQGKR